MPTRGTSGLALLLVVVIVAASAFTYWRLQDKPVATWPAAANTHRTDREEWSVDEYGDFHGARREFAPDGRLVRQTQWEHGVQISEVVYDENGTIRKRVDREGNVFRFDEKGRPLTH